MVLVAKRCPALPLPPLLAHTSALQGVTMYPSNSKKANALTSVAGYDTHTRRFFDLISGFSHAPDGPSNSTARSHTRHRTGKRGFGREYCHARGRSRRLR